MEHGIEVGHIFQLGTKYSDTMGIQVADENGDLQTVQMGCYGIGMTRVIAATVEQCSDDNGIIWPKNIAPFHVHLLGLNLDKDEDLAKKAEDLYLSLKEAGIEVLFDERKMSAGKKFADSDLMGIPVRITISNRSLENGGLEWKERNQSDSEMIAENDIIQKIQDYLEPS